MADAVVLLLFLVLSHSLSCSSSPTTSVPVVRAAVDAEHEYTFVAISSLKPKAACTGHRVSPPHGHQNATWLRLSLSHGPCSPPSSHRRKGPSLAELLRQDELRVQNIQMTLLSAGDDDNAADDEKVKKRPAKSTTTAMEHGPVVDVNVGSASSISTSRIDTMATGGGGRRRRSMPGTVQTMMVDTASDVPWVQCHPPPTGGSRFFDPTRSPTYAQGLQYREKGDISEISAIFRRNCKPCLRPLPVRLAGVRASRPLRQRLHQRTVPVPRHLPRRVVDAGHVQLRPAHHHPHHRRPQLPVRLQPGRTRPEPGQHQLIRDHVARRRPGVAGVPDGGHPRQRLLVLRPADAQRRRVLRPRQAAVFQDEDVRGDADAEVHPGAHAVPGPPPRHHRRGAAAQRAGDSLRRRLRDGLLHGHHAPAADGVPGAARRVPEQDGRIPPGAA
ncbi:uncharacterized protein [Miscanthus floridulus]